MLRMQTQKEVSLFSSDSNPIPRRSNDNSIDPKLNLLVDIQWLDRGEKGYNLHASKEVLKYYNYILIEHPS